MLRLKQSPTTIKKHLRALLKRAAHWDCTSVPEDNAIRAAIDFVAAAPHIATLVNYNWADELRDFEEHQDETDCHVFVALVALDNALRGTNFTPADYIERKPCQN